LNVFSDDTTDLSPAHAAATSVVLAAVVLAMLLLGLLATWIPAQRALSIDPLTLLREE
jgi:ABC-type lipoprotein release transport system permease subunit